MISCIKRFSIVPLALLFSLALLLGGCTGGSGGSSSSSKSSEDRLSNIDLAGATFDSAFDCDINSYDAVLDDNDSPVVSVSVEKMQSGQSVLIDGVSTLTGSLTVANSSKTCNVVVTSEDGSSVRNYVINIRKQTETESNAYLSSLSITGVSLDQTFSKVTYLYTASVPQATSSCTINFEKDASDSTVKFNGTATTATSQTVSLSQGSNSFTIVVTSADATVSYSYTLTITRSSTVSTALSALTLSSGTLSPTFSATTLSYTAQTSSSSFTVTPTAYSSSASITVNGSSVSSGSSSQTFTFGTATSITVPIVVSYSSSSTTYTVVVSKITSSGNAYLAGLSLDCGTVSFGKQTFTYTGYEVENSVTSTLVTATAEDPATATITINGTTATTGVPTSVALTEGEDNLIDVTVVDGTNTHTYLLVVTREGSGGTFSGVYVNIYVPSSWGWSGPYIYYWTDTNTSLCTWASSPTMTAEANSWYSYNVTDYTTINAICKGAQTSPGDKTTGDQKSLTGEVYFVAGTSGWTKYTSAPDSTAPVHSGWSTPDRPVLTVTPDGGEIVSGNSVSITADANCSGSITTSGYLKNGVKVSNLTAFTATESTTIIPFAKNSVGGVTIGDAKSFTVISATQPSITINPTSGSFTDTMSVAVTTTNTSTKYYSIDGGDWTVFTASTLSVGGSTATGSSVTLQIKAVNSTTGEESISSICTYNKVAAYTETFSWDNANVYFVLTDRFYNANTANDASYGRTNNYNSAGLTAVINTATFHGGDIAGLTAKLNAGYFEDLGVNAIWITAPYEQAHGFVGGGWSNGSANYPHYGYHGYYTLDWTEMDKNIGTVEEFRTFVKTAHSQGIRVVMDIVMNHTGYETIADAVEFNYGGVSSSLTLAQARAWQPSSGGWGSFSSYYAAANSSSWNNWWGTNWVRASWYGTSTGGGGSGETDDISYLPDVKNQISETSNVGLPPILVTKWAAETTGYDSWIVPAAKSLRADLGVCPAIYQEKWLAAWVEEFGIDGFRVDTAKHVSIERWAELKALCKTALATWRASSKSDGDDAKSWTDNFWMTGEVWGHGLSKDSYYTTGNFDSLINFNFPKGNDVTSIGSTWSSYASALNNGDDGYNVLSYLNSHDARQNYGWVTTSVNAGTCLLLSPGGVQIYYGDEVVRPLAGDTSYDANQCTRSDYQWSNQNTTVLAHWQKVGNFRKRHVAVGAGSQTDLGNYTYGRTYTINGTTDKVVICINASGSTSVNVSGIFSDGTSVKNYYDGTTATVSSGKVTFTASNGVILIEAAE